MKLKQEDEVEAEKYRIEHQAWLEEYKAEELEKAEQERQSIRQKLKDNLISLSILNAKKTDEIKHLQQYIDTLLADSAKLSAEDQSKINGICQVLQEYIRDINIYQGIFECWNEYSSTDSE